MNILFYRYGSICESDIINGFQELGNHVSEITLEINNKDLTPLEGLNALSDELLAHSYDFVFSINYYPFISEVCNIFQIRYLCWTVDSPVLELYSDSICNPWNRIFLFDRAQYDEFALRNPKCIFHLPLAGNLTHHQSVITHASSLEHTKYTSDISFVGSLYTEKCPYDRIDTIPAYLSGYLEGIMDAQKMLYGCYILENLLPDEIIASFRDCFPNFYIPPEKSLRNDRAVLAQFYLCPKITAMERVQTIELLGNNFPLKLYTASNTSGLPVDSCGCVKTLTEMPLVFYNSKINLNMTSKAIRTGLPLRIFDILSCGGFCLTNYQPELDEFFRIGTDLDCYTCEDELLSKIDYYLVHENDRVEIAHNGTEAIKKYHNYPNRLLNMISIAYKDL